MLTLDVMLELRPPGGRNTHPPADAHGGKQVGNNTHGGNFCCQAAAGKRQRPV
jgi:hypothetical protein